MSLNGTQNISRDDAGEVRRVLILRNWSNDSSTGNPTSTLPVSSTVASNSVPAQHGVHNDNGINETIVSGMLKTSSGQEEEPVESDPSSDLGAEFQHVEEWLKTRSDSLSSLDFESEIKAPEIDINDFFNLKSNVHFQIGGQDFGLAFNKEHEFCVASTGITGTSSTSSQTSGHLDAEGLAGGMGVSTLSEDGDSTGSRQNSFTKKLESLMDKGLFEELLLTDVNRRNGKKVDLGLLSADDKGLFEELLLPGMQEDINRHAQELFNSTNTNEKRTVMSSSGTSNNEVSQSQSVGVKSVVAVSGEESEQVASRDPNYDIDVMARNIQPLKLMSPQELENIATRTLSLDDTSLKVEHSHKRKCAGQLEDEFNFSSFSQVPDDGNSLTTDLLASPSSEVDSKLSSILAMDASNDTIEVPSPVVSEMLETLNKGPTKVERSVSPGTFLVKLEPKEFTEGKDADKLNSISVSSASAMMPPPSIKTEQTSKSDPLILKSGITVALSTSTTTTITNTTTVSNSTSSTHAVGGRGLLKIPTGFVRAELKKLPVGMIKAVPLRLATSCSLSSPSPNAHNNASGIQLPRQALIIRPLSQQVYQKQAFTVSGLPTAGTVGVTNTPVSVGSLIKVLPQTTQATPGKANVTITIDRKANTTSVTVLSSNGEHTLFKINTCDMIRAISSIREPQLDPLGLTTQQLQKFAQTAQASIQEIQQSQNSQSTGISSGGLAKIKDGTGKEFAYQNYQITQLLNECKAPISRTQASQQSALRHNTAATVTPTVSSSNNKETNIQPSQEKVSTEGIAVALPYTSTTPAFPLASTSNAQFPVSVVSTTQATTGLLSVKGSVNSITDADSTSASEANKKIDGESKPLSYLPSGDITPGAHTLIKEEKPLVSGSVKTDNVGLSLRPGAPPTMVSVPSVLDTLSAPIVTQDVVGQSCPSVGDRSGSMEEEEEDMDDPQEMCAVSEEVANKALEELGINIELLEHEPSPQGGKRWPCSINGCSKHFPKLSALKIHLLSHNGIRPYKCGYENCDWAFYTWYKLKRHMETHLKRRDFICTESGCNRRFTTIYNLNTHLRLHRRPKSWMCPLPECSAAFHTRRDLEGHMKGHHKDVEAPHKCCMEGCNKSYFTPNSLTSHMRSHHKDEELRCQWAECGKKFDKPCRLKAHMRIHTGQRPFVCTYEGCNWSFQSASKLSRHQRKHTNDRKFVCPICQKSFLRSEHLKGHLLIHTGVRNFKCPIQDCKAQFTAKSSLYVHLKKHEGKTKESKLTYHCPIDACEKSYHSKFNLRQHMLKNHTPVLATDSTQLDYITLLSDKDIMLDHLVPPSSSTCTSSLEVSSSVTSTTITTSSTDGTAAASLLPGIEFINSDVMTGAGGAGQVVVVGTGSEDEAVHLGDSLFEAATSASNSVVTAQFSGELGLGELSHGNVTLLGTSGSNTLLDGNSSGGSLLVPNATKLGRLLDTNLNDPMSGGSARTDTIGNILLSKRAKKRQQQSLGKKSGCENVGTKMVNLSNDVVLAASAVPLSDATHLHSSLLPDDGELYQEALMGHDLLTDPTTDPQSTINLRDLE